MLLSVQEISKRFGRQQALDRVSFTVREGDVMGLIGPNGAGKTTLFECVAGLLPANRGAVVFRDRRLAPTRRKEALFYMPDGILPWAEQTVRWALGFFEKLYPNETSCNLIKLRSSYMAGSTVECVPVIMRGYLPVGFLGDQ